MQKNNSNSESIVEWFQVLQDDICEGLERLDGHGKFQEDLWQRDGGGGGRTRVLNGKHIEKGGVNFSKVYGQMSKEMAVKLEIPSGEFSATGVSIVLHAKNPFVPIIHMNVRYFEMNENIWWFGGGIDVTPHYLNIKNAIYFHNHLKSTCDNFHPDAYQEYKKWADDYFYISHREETRGVGGIFFDRLGDLKKYKKEKCWSFVKEVGTSFIDIYSKLFLDNYKKAFTSEHEKWQKVRRGRYVEFNLVYDRGTKFGLETSGRIESILMSLPPEAHWEYDYKVKPRSTEEKMQSHLKKGIDWVNYKAE